MKILCVDIETTGFAYYKNDEVLQLSIIDGDYNVLFNKYIKPIKNTSWDAAMAVHGITPDLVSNEKTFTELLPEINELFADADIIIGYNLKSFDLPFLAHFGVTLSPKSTIYDVMHIFSPIWGDWNDYHQSYKWQKLSTCANYYGYGDFKAHDSLEDVKATLHCYYQMLKEGHIK